MALKAHGYYLVYRIDRYEALGYILVFSEANLLLKTKTSALNNNSVYEKEKFMLKNKNLIGAIVAISNFLKRKL